MYKPPYNATLFDLPRVSVSPDRITAGEWATFTVTFGGLALPAGTVIQLNIHGGRTNKGNWGQPQLDDPQGDNYCSAATSQGQGLQLSIPLLKYNVSQLLIHVGADASADEDIIVRLGDTSGGSRGFRAQTFTQHPHYFDLSFPDENGEQTRVAANPPGVEVVGGPLHQLCLFVPSGAAPGEQFRATIKARDEYDNVAAGFTGRVHISFQGTVLREIEMTAENGGLFEIEDLALEEPGVQRLTVSLADGGGEWLSNPVMVSADAKQHVYWGILHGHTAWSDGTGDLENYFANLRDENRMDFGALGDHDHAYETSDEQWAQIQETTARWNEPGQFVTFLGYEWAKWRRNGDGDRNVYYLEDYQPFFRSEDGAYPTPTELFEVLADRQAIVIPHHPAISGTWCDWKEHDPTKERLVEIFSVWGNSERSVHDGSKFPLKPGGCAGQPLDAAEIPVGFVQHGLYLGRRLGFVAGGDDHWGRPGDQNPHWQEVGDIGHPPGIMAVWAEDLTRQSLFSGMYERCTYGTTGARMLIDFRLAGQPMGTDIPVTNSGEFATRTLHIAVYGTDDIAQVEIVRNNRVVHEITGEGLDLEADWTDEDALELILLRPADQPPFCYYYLRVTQADGETAWVSPIWLTLAETD